MKRTSCKSLCGRIKVFVISSAATKWSMTSEKYSKCQTPFLLTRPSICEAKALPWPKLMRKMPLPYSRYFWGSNLSIVLTRTGAGLEAYFGPAFSESFSSSAVGKAIMALHRGKGKTPFLQTKLQPTPSIWPHLSASTEMMKVTLVHESGIIIE